VNGSLTPGPAIVNPVVVGARANPFPVLLLYRRASIGSCRLQRGVGTARIRPVARAGSGNEAAVYDLPLASLPSHRQKSETKEAAVEYLADMFLEPSRTLLRIDRLTGQNSKMQGIYQN